MFNFKKNKSDNNQPNPQCAEINRWLEQAQSAHLAATERVRQNKKSVLPLDTNGNHRLSLIHSTLQSLLPHIYARNPQISVVPRESLNHSDYANPGALQSLAKTIEIVVNRLLIDAGLKKFARNTVRKALVNGVGWVKIIWNDNYYSDPIAKGRPADVQQTMATINSTEDERTNSEEDNKIKKDTIAQLKDSLTSPSRIDNTLGLVIDIVDFENIIIDPNITEFDCIDKASRIAQKITLPLKKAKSMFPYANWENIGQSGDQELERNYFDLTKDNKEQTITVFEVWDLGTRKVYTLASGATDWLRPPYSPQHVGKRWFPFFGLALNPTEGQFWPLSIVELMEKTQNEYNDVREKFSLHRKRAVPARVFNGSLLSEQDMAKITNREILEDIALSLPPGENPANALQSLDYPRIDPALYDTSHIRYDAELMSGLQDAQRGAISRPKTATEAQIMESGLTSRLSAMQDMIEDWVEDIAKYVVQTALNSMTLEQAIELAGDGAVWSSLASATNYSKLNVIVRAGTTGKPDRMRERQQWVELLPLIQNTINQIAQAQQAGATHVVQAQTELLRETVRRMDERIDVEQFIPSAPPPPEPQAQAPTATDANVAPQTQAINPGSSMPIDANSVQQVLNQIQQQ